MKSILKKSKQIIIKKKSQQCYLLAPYQTQTNKPFNTMSLLTMPFDSHRPMNNEKNSYTKNSNLQMVRKSTEAVRPPGRDTCKENMPNFFAVTI